MITATVLAEDSLPLRVAVDFPSGDLVGGTVEVEVIASTADGSRSVRSLSSSWRIPASGGAYIEDYEVELGVEVTYQARQYNAGGTMLGLTAPVVVQADIPTDQLIVQDPLAPRSWVRLGGRAATASQLTTSRTSALYRRGAATVGLLGETGLLEGVPVEAVTESPADAARLAAVLAEGYVLVRSMPPVPLPRCLHALVSSVSRAWGAAADDDFTVWPLSLDEVSSSRVPIIESPLTWDRYKATYATWAAMKAAYSTWLDAKKSPPPEV